MSYAVSDDLAERLAPETLIALADDNGDGEADSAAIQAALNDASAAIDQALAGRYVTPVDPAPEILTRWCVDLAVEDLYLRKNEALPGEAASRAELTRRAMESVRDGIAGLACATPLLDSMAADCTMLEENATFSKRSLRIF